MLSVKYYEATSDLRSLVGIQEEMCLQQKSKLLLMMIIIITTTAAVVAVMLHQSWFSLLLWLGWGVNMYMFCHSDTKWATVIIQLNSKNLINLLDLNQSTISPEKLTHGAYLFKSRISGGASWLCMAKFEGWSSHLGCHI